MALKQRLLAVLERGHAVQQAFVAGLSNEQRAAVGTYEKWSAKDAVAHLARWQDHRAAVVAARARGEEPPPSPGHYEQANAACFQRFCNRSWDEVQAFADAAYANLVDSVRALPEETLAAPPESAGERTLWQAIVNTAYTHPLMHMAEFYIAQGHPHRAGQLWPEWGELMAPLDDSADWQGLVHYNVACGLALSGNPDAAIVELRQALQLRPDLTAWSRQDSDLAAVRVKPEYRTLYAPEYWWTAMEANPQAEALADQFVRALSMLREAVKAFPAGEWRKGDTPYQRPAGLALHAMESLERYAVLKPGESGQGRRPNVDWEDKDSTKLPSQDDLLAYLDEVEQRLARFLATADLAAAEELFRWTGSTLLSRVAYALRHTQHHLAEMCLELHRLGYKAPQWQ
jgi:tetratricopeptide (TPR) repeat protein